VLKFQRLHGLLECGAATLRCPVRARGGGPELHRQSRKGIPKTCDAPEGARTAMAKFRRLLPSSFAGGATQPIPRAGQRQKWREGLAKFQGDPMSLQETPKKRACFDRQGHEQPLKTAQIRKKTVKIQKFLRAHIWWCCPTSTLHIPHFALKIPKTCLENTKKHIKLTKFYLTGKMRSSYKCTQDASRVSLFTFLIQTADKGTISAEGYKHGRDKRSHGHSRGVGVSWSVARNSL